MPGSWTGYNWQSGKLDPSIMNVEEDESKLLPHLIRVKNDYAYAARKHRG